MMENSFNLRDKLFSGIVWRLLERVLSQGIAFLVSIALARILAPDEYGIVAIVLVFISLANVFVTSGFSTALVQNKNATDTDFSTNFYCSLAMSILIYVILFMVAPYISAFYKIELLLPVLRVFALRIPLSAISSIQHAYVERHMMFKKYFFSTLIGTVASGIVGILLAIKGFGVWALVTQNFLSTIVDIAVLFVIVPWRPKLIFSYSSAKRMMDYGWKILIADFFGTFFDQLRSLVVGRVYTATDLAFYDKGNQLPSLISSNVNTSIMTVLFPAIANINDDLTRIYELTRRSVQVVSYIMFPMMFGLAAISDNLIVFLFTDKWLQSSEYMKILSIGYAFSILGGVSIQSLKALGRSDIVLKLEFIKKPVYLILLLIGVHANVAAIAVTMALYNIYGAVVNASQLSRTVRYTVREQLEDLFSPMVLSGIMYVIVSHIQYAGGNPMLSIIIQIILGVVVYIGLSHVSKQKTYVYLLEILKDKFGVS